MTDSPVNDIRETVLGELNSSSFATGLTLTSDEKVKIADFCAYLYMHNQMVNLVSNAEPQYLVRRHILDSLSLLELIDSSGVDEDRLRLIDIGSGAGLPGLILALVLKKSRVLLVDSTRKKVDFLQTTINKLALQDRVTAKSARAEELAREQGGRESFNLATCRAVGHLRIVAELALPLLSVGGILLCQKTSKQANSELAQSIDHIKRLGGVSQILVPSIQTGETEHCVIRVEKVARTKLLYPRSYTVMKKECEAL